MPRLALLVLLTVFAIPTVAVAQQTAIAVLVRTTFPGATAAQVSGVNNRGWLVGNYSVGERSRGFIQKDGQFFAVDPPLSDVTHVRVEDLDERGDMVGSYVRGERTHGFVIKEGEFTSFDAPVSNLVGTEIFGLNARGAIVGRFTYLDEATGRRTERGFVVEQGAFRVITLPFEGVRHSAAFGINDAGVIVGGYTAAELAAVYDHGFVLAPGADAVTLDPPPSREIDGGALYAINNRGDILGNRSIVRNGVFEPLEVRIIDAGLVGFPSAVFSDLDDHGRVVGYVMQPRTGPTYGFLGTMFPTR